MLKGRRPAFPDHFSDSAAAYCAFRPRYPAELFAHLAGLVTRHDLAWDAGTGNGQTAVDLARYFERVIATDASAEQIAHAEVNPRVEYRVARSEDPGIAPGSVNLVTVSQALHWFDIPRFFEAATRALAPGGAVAVWCYGWATVSPEVDALIKELNAGPLAGCWPKERDVVETGYSTVPFPFAEEATPRFALTAEWDAGAHLGYMRTWSATRRYRQTHGADPVVGIEDRFRSAWGPGVRWVEWPLSLRVGRPKAL